MRGNLVRDLLHGQLLVGHSLAVKLKTEQPGRDPGRVKVWHLIVDIHKLLVLSDDRVKGLRVVVYGSIGSDFTQSSILDTTEHILRDEITQGKKGLKKRELVIR